MFFSENVDNPFTLCNLRLIKPEKGAAVLHLQSSSFLSKEAGEVQQTERGRRGCSDQLGWADARYIPGEY